jgi:ribonuclease R
LLCHVDTVGPIRIWRLNTDPLDLPAMDKNKRVEDPYAEREAQRYPNPIPSREYILNVIRSHKGPCTFERLFELLKLNNPEQRDALERRLTAMVRDGQLLLNRRDGYMPVNERDLLVGRVIAHPDGFGFLRPDTGGDDLFIPAKHMRSLMHGDRVVMRVTGMDHRGRQEASLIEVLERANKRLVGRLFMEGEIAYVVPDNKRIPHEILIPPQQLSNAKPGQIVTVDIIEQPSKHRPPVGAVASVLGDHMAPGMEIEVAINANGIPHEWPAEVLQDVAGYREEVAAQDKAGRLDVRDKPLVTIDGEDAKDFDDAVYCEALGSGWRLYVAIADVSHYVKSGSALDKEAYNRGNSVYFPQRVIPMLPEVLSNGLCSLNPDVDRLCMLCILEFDRSGRILSSRFEQGLMRSQARLTYTQVSAMLEKREMEVRRRYEKLVPHLECLYALYKVLFAQRQKRGAIDLDTTETRIIFDSDRKIQAIVPTVRNDAHRLIEECMIAANIAAAAFLAERKMPTLYRVHESPPADKLEDLVVFLGELGLKFPARKNVEARHFAALLNSIRERPDFHLIQTVMLRSLAQAQYQPANKGHFGLALEEYAHFTSPIRRYPDLLVHRGIRHCLNGGHKGNFEYAHEQMMLLGEHASMTERRADEATRDAVDWLKCEYMQDKIGETFEGVITGVTSFGLFVELADIYVEGLIHITALPKDYYQFDAVGHKLVGERSGRFFQLADRLKVQVAGVSLDERKIDFELVEQLSTSRRRRRRR